MQRVYRPIKNLRFTYRPFYSLSTLKLPSKPITPSTPSPVTPSDTPPASSSPSSSLPPSPSPSPSSSPWSSHVPDACPPYTLQSLKYPIVLCHGLLGFGRSGPLDYWRGVKKHLQKHGAVVEITSVSSTASIAERAKQLGDQIKLVSNKYNTKVHIIAHSMGGLDSRYLTSRLGGNELVQSITTLASPHRGSSIADWGISRTSVGLSVLEMLNFFAIPTEVFLQLTPQYLSEVFNPETPDHPEVAYFSYGASKECQMVNPLYFFNKLLRNAEGDNDGLVSVTSSKWGEYLGTLPCDHMELINWNPLYDASPHYLKIAHSLSKYESDIVKKSGA